MSQTINVKPKPKQYEAYEKLFDKKTDYVFYGGAVGGGKSFLIAEWLLLMCLQYPGTSYFIGRSELKALMGTTYKTFMEVAQIHGLKKDVHWKLNGQYNYIIFKNGSVIDLLDLKYAPTDPEYSTFGSREYVSGAIEEAAEVHVKAFDVLKTRVGRISKRLQEKYPGIPVKLLITANPTKNWVYSIAYKPWKAGELPENIAFIPATSKDNDSLPPEYYKRLESISDPVTKDRLVHGNWEYDDTETALLKYDDILNMFSVFVERTGKMYATVDVSRMGKDTTRMAIWNGFVLERVILISSTNLVETARIISDNLNKYKIPRRNCAVDEIGVGGGVVDLLNGVVGFVANSSPIKNEYARHDINMKQNFRNMRTQCIFLMSDKIKRGEVAVIDKSVQKELIEELEQWKLKELDSGDNKLAIISKDEMRESLGRSPDIGDVVYMRMVFELDKPYLNGIYTQDERSGKENMYEDFLNKFDKYSPL